MEGGRKSNASSGRSTPEKQVRRTSLSGSFAASTGSAEKLRRFSSGGGANSIDNNHQSHNIRRTNSEAILNRQLSVESNNSNNANHKRASSTNARRNRGNSLRFRQVDIEWTPDQLLNDGGNGDTESGSVQMEVMDLRPSTHPSVTMMATSSFMSISSNISIDSESINGMCQVSIANSSEEILRNDLPSHWDKAGENTQEQQQQIQGRLTNRSVNTIDITTTSLNGGGGCGVSAPRRKSMNSIGSGSSISVGEQPSCSSGGSGSTINSSDAVVDAKWKRKMYVRRMVRATVGFVALAALTASVIYFVSAEGSEEGESIFSMSASNVLGDWFGGTVEEKTGLDAVRMVKEERGQAELELAEEHRDRVRRRKARLARQHAHHQP